MSVAIATHTRLFQRIPFIHKILSVSPAKNIMMKKVPGNPLHYFKEQKSFISSAAIRSSFLKSFIAQASAELHTTILHHFTAHFVFSSSSFIPFNLVNEGDSV